MQKDCTITEKKLILNDQLKKHKDFAILKLVHFSRNQLKEKVLAGIFKIEQPVPFSLAIRLWHEA